MKRIPTILGTTLCLLGTTRLGAQRGTAPALVTLSPPSVAVSATPVAVTVSWKPVSGAGYYTVEQSTSPSGPWTPLAVDARAGTQVTAPTAAATNTAGGTLYYYRVSAMLPLGPRGEVPLGEPGITIVPRVTPRLNAPLGVDPRQEGPDIRLSWVPVPFATSYVVTAATGTQVPPTYGTEVGAQVTEARFSNVATTSPGLQAWWVSVAARYGAGGALSVPTTQKIGLAPAQFCWPAATVPGPAPVVSLTAYGPTAFAVVTPGVQQGLTSMRVERALMGSAAWQGVGCTTGASHMDMGLTPATQYQYRVTEFAPTGASGQTIVVATTAPAPDSPIPTVTLSGCTANGCQGFLSWTGFVGAEDYRTESSYGIYYGQMMAGSTATGGISSAGGPLNQGLGLVPKGVHTFTLTPLFPMMRPSPRPPGQVTVVVP